MAHFFQNVNKKLKIIITFQPGIAQRLLSRHMKILIQKTRGSRFVIFKILIHEHLKHYLKTFLLQEIYFIRTKEQTNANTVLYILRKI